MCRCLSPPPPRTCKLVQGVHDFFREARNGKARETKDQSSRTGWMNKTQGKKKKSTGGYRECIPVYTPCQLFLASRKPLAAWLERATDAEQEEREGSNRQGLEGTLAVNRCATCVHKGNCLYERRSDLIRGRPQAHQPGLRNNLREGESKQARTFPAPFGWGRGWIFTAGAMNGSGEFGILDKQIDVLRTGGILPEKDIISLCTKVGLGFEKDKWVLLRASPSLLEQRYGGD